MDKQRRPGWAFWTTVVVLLLPVLYIASFGPACWAAQHGHLGRLPVAYEPLIARVAHRGWLGRLLGRYASSCDGSPALESAVLRYRLVSQHRRNEEILRKGGPVFRFEFGEVSE